MGKNIAVFLDGTWNDKENHAEQSNVALMHGLCLDDGQTQISYYDSGVGTQWYDRKIGGLSGAGLSTNIRQAYQFLSEHHQPGDKVFIVGFSRGAYSARSLAGLLYRCGLPAGDTSVERAYEVYRSRDEASMAQLRVRSRPCPVGFLGVWDTVGALGIPLGSLIKKASAAPFEFHDTALSPEVGLACHAVAIDERRSAFEPTLWQVDEDNQHRVRQVWFAGAHSDVGGGYPERHHSNVPLLWMIEQAMLLPCGGELRLAPHFDRDALEEQVDLSRDVHDSAYRLFGLELAAQERQAQFHQSPPSAVHASVGEKMALRPDYTPLALYLGAARDLSAYRIERRPEAEPA